MSLLETKVAEFAANIPDWQVAEALNAPDPNLPKKLSPTRVGPGTVLATLGPEGGATLLETLTALSSANAAIKWAMEVIRRGELDLSTAAARGQIDALAAGGVMTAAQANLLKSLAEGQHKSWAEANNITVDVRAVGLARGGR